MNAVYVPGYTIEDQRAGRAMSLAQALEVSELASPNPWSAAHALRALRQALQITTRVLGEIRDSAGLPPEFPIGDVSQAVAELRRKACAWGMYETCADLAALRAFAKAVMRTWPEGAMEADELQDTAVKHGLLALKDPPPTEACGEHCMCVECVTPEELAQGVRCYRRTALLTGRPE